MSLPSCPNTFTYRYRNTGCDESLKFLADMQKKSLDCKRLQDICLYSVVRNFKAIMQEYVQNVAVNSRKLKFLTLQHYSKTLFECLLLFKKYVVMEEPYVSFLINPYNRELDLTACGSSYITGLLEVLKFTGHAITSINLSGMALELEMLDYLLALLPNLEVINLSRVTTKDTSLEIIHKRCPLLKSLFLSNAEPITNHCLAMLCTMNEANTFEKNPNIESLDLRNTKITIEGIVFALQHFPSLKELYHPAVAYALYILHCNDIICGNLDNVQKYTLQQLHIDSWVDIGRLLKICAVLCPDLNYLSLSNLPRNVDIWLHFPHLKKVNFHLRTGRNMTFVNEFLSLQKDNLEICNIPITTLSQCSKLHQLSLTHSVFERLDESLKPSPDIFLI